LNHKDERLLRQKEAERLKQPLPLPQRLIQSFQTFEKTYTSLWRSMEEYAEQKRRMKGLIYLLSFMNQIKLIKPTFFIYCTTEHRSNVAQEILKTERTYNNNLNTLITVTSFNFFLLFSIKLILI
jgi:hypothetical protein